MTGISERHETNYEKRPWRTGRRGRNRTPSSAMFKQRSANELHAFRINHDSSGQRIKPSLVYDGRYTTLPWTVQRGHATGHHRVDFFARHSTTGYKTATKIGLAEL